MVGAALLGAALALASACSSSSSSSSNAWCCTEIGGICICEPAQGGCGGRQPSCKAIYSCCGVTHDSNGTGCSCASDSFLQSLNETCDEWFTSGGGSGRQAVSSCPPP